MEIQTPWLLYFQQFTAITFIDCSNFLAVGNMATHTHRVWIRIKLQIYLHCCREKKIERRRPSSYFPVGTSKYIHLNYAHRTRNCRSACWTAVSYACRRHRFAFYSMQKKIILKKQAIILPLPFPIEIALKYNIILIAPAAATNRFPAGRSAVQCSASTEY